LNYKEAKKQYNEFRNKVYQKVERELTDRFQKPVQLTCIDINALKAWREQWCPRLAERKRFTEEELFWNWVNTMREMSNVPSRFERYCIKEV